MRFADDEFIEAKLNKGTLINSYVETTDEEFKNIIVRHFLGYDTGDLRNQNGEFNNTLILLKLLENHPVPLRTWFSVFTEWFAEKIKLLFKIVPKLTVEQKMLYIGMLEAATNREIKFVDNTDVIELIWTNIEFGVVCKDIKDTAIAVIPMIPSKVEDNYLLDFVYIWDNCYINGELISDMIDVYNGCLENLEKTDKAQQ
jgi:hypothetical protein